MRDFFSEVIKKWVLPYSKAWATVVVGGLTSALAFVGLDLDAQVATSLTLAITAFFNWLLPNVPYASK